MINVKVEFLLYNNKDKMNIAIESGSSVEALLQKLQLAEKAKDFFYIVNGSNKMKTYILQDEDYIKIFPAMSGG